MKDKSNITRTPRKQNERLHGGQADGSQRGRLAARRGRGIGRGVSTGGNPQTHQSSSDRDSKRRGRSAVTILPLFKEDDVQDDIVPGYMVLPSIILIFRVWGCVLLVPMLP